MGWRDLVTRREARRVLEDRDLPPRMRQGPPDGERVLFIPLAIGCVAGIGTLIYWAWNSGHRNFAHLIWIMSVIAVGTVVGITRSHRASNAKTLRKPPQAEEP